MKLHLLIALLITACVPKPEETKNCRLPGAPVSTTSHGLAYRAEFELGPEPAVVRDEVVGVTLSHPSGWRVTPDPYLFETYGFMLREPDRDPSDLHGPLPAARIALDYSAAPADIPSIIARKREEYPGVPMQEYPVMVGGHFGIALGPVPGGQVSTNVYFSVNGRVYRINYYGDALDDRGQAILDALEFHEPERTVESLSLQRAAVFSGEVPQQSAPAVALSRSALEAREDDCELAVDESAVHGGEHQIAEGCWTQPTWFFIQTVHSWDANGDGWTRMGTPNFWGDNTHGNWGLGRCVSTYYTNDLYAIDYYMNAWDRVISPFAEGYVRYAGWDPENWWNYGNMVVISDPSGKYWSLSAHLAAVNVYPGQYVDDDTLIGWAGSTGYADPYPHVHQVFYRWPYSSYGRPYGGQGLMQTALSYVGNGGGTYYSFWKGKWVSW